ncbi:MAG: AAA family ATPase [Terrimicrobiaceae bacterium]
MIDLLRETYRRLLAGTSIRHHRFLFSSFDMKERLVGLVGPRGVGKTTLMLQYIRERVRHPEEAFYASADHIYFNKVSLLDFVRDAVASEGTHLFFFDEVHKYPGWEQELKNIYDSFPSVHVAFSGSSSLALTKGGYDLSRRAFFHRLPGLSFREYLNFSTGADHAPISLEALLHDPGGLSEKLAQVPKLAGYFRRYLKEGFYPYVFEGNGHYYEKIRAVVEKTIYEDVATHYRLKTENLHYFKKILCFLGTIPPGETNVHKLGVSLGVDDKTAANYLQILQETGLIRLLESPGRGHALIRKHKKTFLDNTTLHHAICHGLGQTVDPGAVRELFFLQATGNAGLAVVSSDMGGDFKIGDSLFEVGGRNKGGAQLPKASRSEYVVKDDILVGSKRTLPLYLFGFLY